MGTQIQTQNCPYPESMEVIYCNQMVVLRLSHTGRDNDNDNDNDDQRLIKSWTFELIWTLIIVIVPSVNEPLGMRQKHLLLNFRLQWREYNQ